MHGTRFEVRVYSTNQMVGLQLHLDPPKRNLGAIYTPPILARWVAELLAGQLTDRESPVVLDPACGDGALLLAVHERLNGKVRLVGWDIDPVAIAAARQFLPGTTQLLNRDSLVSTDGRFPAARPDGIIVNPPWGSEFGCSTPE